jgi:F-type H+-transporting ATPase subunit epsilon
MADPTTVKSLDVHIVTPSQEVWAGPASFIVARSIEGELGVLPGHEPLLAALGDGPLEVTTPSGKVTAVVDGGFLSVGTSEGDVTRVDVLAEHVHEVHAP